MLDARGKGRFEGTEPDPRPVPGLTRLRTYTEIKTVWHPVGR